MKTKLIIIHIAVFAFATVSQSHCAESEFARQLTQLDKQRDEALAIATAPVYRRYKESLEQLLRRATQGNDLDAAIKIRAALKAIPTPDAGGKQPVPSVIILGTDSKGTLIGSATKGQKITLQYVEGQWTYAPPIESASPDKAPASFQQLAIYGVSKGNVERIAVVPTNTKARPFVQLLSKDYEEIRLRMNDSIFIDNSGNATYTAVIK